MFRYFSHLGMSSLILVCGAAALLIHSHFAVGGIESSPKTNGHTIVIVHGAWGGGWSWKQVDHLLSADGNIVYRPTLTGQGEREHLASPSVGLDTHIADIVNVIRYEDLHDIVLVGHSYGGMVITGVAQQVPERISRLIYLDALLPEDGDNVNMILPNQHGEIKNGLILPSWKINPEPPHDVPQPAKTFSDKIKVRNPAAQKLPADYVLFVPQDTKIEEARFYSLYQRAIARKWPTFILASDHNAWRSHPNELVKLLEKIIE